MNFLHTLKAICLSLCLGYLSFYSIVHQEKPQDSAYLVGRWWYNHLPEGPRDPCGRLYFTTWPGENGEPTMLYVAGSRYQNTEAWGTFIPNGPELKITWLQSNAALHLKYKITRGDFGKFDLKMEIETETGEAILFSRVDGNF